WDELLADLRLQPADDLQQASLVAAKVSGAGSPLRLLLQLVRTHTAGMLRQPEAEGATGALAEKAVAAAEQAAARNKALQAVLGGEAAEAAAPGASIEAHFAELNQLTEGAAGATPLDRTLAAIDELGKALLTMTSFDAGQPNPQLLAARQLVSQLPPPVAGWLSTLTGDSESLVASGARDALAAQAREAIGSDCADYVRGRYPFDPTAETEIPLQDFGELFAQGGRFDSLYRESLARLIDSSRTPWRWREGPGMTGGPPALPARMQAADGIRRAYFRAGPLPEVRFTLRRPVVGGLIARVLVDIDGQTFDSAQGGDRVAPMQWPGPTPGQASITAFDIQGGQIGRIVHQGEWALFRLLREQSLTSCPTSISWPATRWPAAPGRCRCRPQACATRSSTAGSRRSAAERRHERGAGLFRQAARGRRLRPAAAAAGIRRSLGPRLLAGRGQCPRPPRRALERGLSRHAGVALPALPGHRRARSLVRRAAAGHRPGRPLLPGGGGRARGQPRASGRARRRRQLVRRGDRGGVGRAGRSRHRRRALRRRHRRAGPAGFAGRTDPAGAAARHRPQPARTVAVVA